MTQQDIADKLNITSKAVSKWERGLSFPDVGILEKLSEILDITVMDLLSGEIHATETVDASIAERSVKDAVHLSKAKISNKTKVVLSVAIALLLIAITLLVIGKVQRYYGIGMVGGSEHIYSISQINADKIVIKHEINSDITDYEDTITDMVVVGKVLDIYNTMKIRDMSKPMENDRFMITFYYGGTEIATWYVDNEGMTSGSSLRIGNHIIENENFNYSYFLQLYYESLIESLNTQE